MLRLGPAQDDEGLALVPAVPDFDRCSDCHVAGERLPGEAVPAVPDFDRCSDSAATATVSVVVCPSSSRLRSVLRPATTAGRDCQGESQQFPTSIGAQTGPAGAGIRSPSKVPAVPDFDRCSDLRHLRHSDALGLVPAVPDFDRCSDMRPAFFDISRSDVPAVPDFDRCSDPKIPMDPRPVRRWSPSSSRLRSVLRPEELGRPNDVRHRPSSSRLRSVLRPAHPGHPTHHVLVPAVPDFDRCSDKSIVGDIRESVASQQFPTSIGAQTIKLPRPW